jgi:hypothetical protein
MPECLSRSSDEPRPDGTTYYQQGLLHLSSGTPLNSSLSASISFNSLSMGWYYSLIRPLHFLYFSASPTVTVTKCHEALNSLKMMETLENYSGRSDVGELKVQIKLSSVSIVLRLVRAL